jgi:hypothetical protein
MERGLKGIPMITGECFFNAETLTDTIFRKEKEESFASK